MRSWNKDGIEVARLLMERGGAPAGPGLIRRLLNGVRQTKEVRLESPIPLLIQS